MQAPGKPGPKILFEVSQVESSVRCRIYVTASSQGWARHPHTPLPESDSGKITIQGWAERNEAQRDPDVPGKPDPALPGAQLRGIKAPMPHPRTCRNQQMCASAHVGLGRRRNGVIVSALDVIGIEVVARGACQSPGGNQIRGDERSLATA